jgi:hypothetical protein
MSVHRPAAARSAPSLAMPALMSSCVVVRTGKFRWDR